MNAWRQPRTTARVATTMLFVWLFAIVYHFLSGHFGLGEFGVAAATVVGMPDEYKGEPIPGGPSDPATTGTTC